MKIQLAELRRATNRLFDHLEHLGHTEVELTEDFYWSVPDANLYSVYQPPASSELNVGQLTDDWSELQKIASGQNAPVTYAFVWLSSLLRFIGSRIVA